ncbi:MAG TPA: hypothetical protein PL124_12315 [Candidatus Cloacimonadota bacterium]|nr:hypothetical protein [Candidatus Cloacimonadota bacterium]
MTKQEFENAEQKLKDSYVCDSDYYPRLVDLDSEYIASLEAENEGLRTRIAELESENKYLGNMPVNTVKAPDAIIYDNALDANRELKITVKRQQEHIAELEKSIENHLNASKIAFEALQSWDANIAQNYAAILLLNQSPEPPRGVTNDER